MRFFTARRLTLAALLPVLFSFALIPGCSKQGEGDRCGDEVGRSDDSECDDGLVCTTIDSSASIYRCCNPTRTTNTRCIKVTASANGGAVNGGAGEANGGSGGARAGEGGGAGDLSPTTAAGSGGS